MVILPSHIKYSLGEHYSMWDVQLRIEQDMIYAGHYPQNFVIWGKKALEALVRSFYARAYIDGSI